MTQNSVSTPGETPESAQKRKRGPSSQQLKKLLKRDILAGDLVPNQRLVEVDLCAEYGASRGNVRIALSELDSEGIIERVPNQGARVRAVSVDEAVEITEVRAALEALCASKAAERITVEQQEYLQEVGERMRVAVDEGARDEYSLANRDLHSKIIEISGQQVAGEIINRLRSQAVRYQFQLAQQAGRPKTSLPQHLAVINAICSHAPQAAAEAMTLHLASVADAIRKSTNQAPYTTEK